MLQVGLFHLVLLLLYSLRAKKDLELLKAIKKFFNEIGFINVSNNFVHYKVRSVKELSIIITHFYKYPLLGEKNTSFRIWIQNFTELDNIKDKT